MGARQVALAAGAVALVVAVGAVLGAGCSGRKDIVVGVPEPATTLPLAAPTVPPQPESDTAKRSSGAPRRSGAAIALKPATGRPFGPPIPFTSSIPVPEHLVFVLVVGSDARPGEPVERARADSIHLLAANPASGEGTVVGFPRDAYVDIPGHGKGKINDALARGGPDLLAATVQRLTGLPVHFYVVTGFTGFKAMVDVLGGVDVHVDHRMADKASGAYFEPGWHHFNGAEALAYTRNRKDQPDGDFTRSQNQGNLLLATLGKLRSEVGDDPSLLRWVDVLRRHARLDVPAGDLPRLAAAARLTQPERVHNVVVPGRITTVRGASVVVLDRAAASALFTDLRDDAVIGTAGPATTTTTTTTSTTTTSTTTTTAPAPTTSTTTAPGPTTSLLPAGDGGG